MRRKLIALILAPLLLALPALAAADERVKGYAEYRRGGALIVEGQVVRATAATRFDGDFSSLDTIPLGYEVEARGERQSDGTILATEIEAKPNGDAMFEGDVLAATDQIEAAWVEAGRMYEPDENGDVAEDIGPLLDGGSHQVRIDRLMRRLTPPYVDYDEQVRVYVVDTEDWNAAAMGNGAIWVYTGLMESMSDDELAIVLGHELAHYTHEHSRRQAKTNMWQGIAGLGAILIGEVIGTDASRAVAGIGAALGLTVWGSGYSRDLEDQADRVGLRYAHEGGFDVAAGPTLWAKFRARYGEPDEITNFFLGSHSRPSDRIENLLEEIRLNYPERLGSVSTEVDVAPAPGTRSETEASARAEEAARAPEGGMVDPSDYVAQVEAQLDAIRARDLEGFTPVEEPEIDELEADGVSEYELPVAGGIEYLVVGVCDDDCDDLDLIVHDDWGEQIAIDVEPDDYPVLRFAVAEAGLWSLEVRMPGCAAATCVFGIEVYARE